MKVRKVFGFRVLDLPTDNSPEVSVIDCTAVRGICRLYEARQLPGAEPCCIAVYRGDVERACLALLRMNVRPWQAYMAEEDAQFRARWEAEQAAEAGGAPCTA